MTHPFPTANAKHDPYKATRRPPRTEFAGHVTHVKKRKTVNPKNHLSRQKYPLADGMSSAFMVRACLLKTDENLNHSEEKAENVQFFSG